MNKPLDVYGVEWSQSDSWPYHRAQELDVERRVRLILGGGGDFRVARRGELLHRRRRRGSEQRVGHAGAQRRQARHCALPGALLAGRPLFRPRVYIPFTFTYARSFAAKLEYKRRIKN